MSAATGEQKKLGPDEFRKRQLIMTSVFRSLLKHERDELAALLLATAPAPPDPDWFLANDDIRAALEAAWTEGRWSTTGGPDSDDINPFQPAKHV